MCQLLQERLHDDESYSICYMKSDRPFGSDFFEQHGQKIKKKSPPAGKFGLVFGLLGFWVLIF